MHYVDTGNRAEIGMPEYIYQISTLKRS